MKAAEDAQRLKTRKNFSEARDRLAICSRDVCPKAVRDDCLSWSAQLDAAFGSVVLYAEDEVGHSLVDVRVLVDDVLLTERLDNNAVPLLAGEHWLRFEIPGRPPVVQRIELRGGEKNRRVVAVIAPKAPVATPSSEPLVPVQAPERIHPAAWVLYGVSGAALGAFAYLGLSARSDVATLRDTCAPRCAHGDVDSAHTRLIAADISLGVALASAGVATWLVFHPSSPSSAPAGSSGSPGSPGSTRHDANSPSSTSSFAVSPLHQGAWAGWVGQF